jgi:hypothetical protein
VHPEIHPGESHQQDQREGDQPDQELEHTVLHPVGEQDGQAPEDAGDEQSMAAREAGRPRQRIVEVGCRPHPRKRELEQPVEETSPGQEDDGEERASAPAFEQEDGRGQEPGGNQHARAAVETRGPHDRGELRGGQPVDRIPNVPVEGEHLVLENLAPQPGDQRQGTGRAQESDQQLQAQQLLRFTALRQSLP